MALDIQLPIEHPGYVIAEWILPSGITITEAAKLLGVSRQSLDALVNGRRSVTPEMAIKLETVFGGTAHTFLAMQRAFDLQEARKKTADITKGLTPFKTHPSLQKPKSA